MTHSKESLADRRKELAEKAGRERAELGLAYQNLAKPFAYTQKAVVGIKALQKNAWLVGLAPSVVGLVFSFLGYEKKGKGKRFGSKTRLTKDDEAAAIVANKKPLQRWLGRGWALFQLYRRVRPFFP